MPEVVIGRCHGGWEKSNGFAEVPTGTSLYLFNNGLRTMAADRADGLLLRSTEGVVASQGEATEVIEPGTGIFNFTTSDLTPEDEVWEGPLDQGIELIQGGWSLQDVFDTYPGSNVYWFACTSRVRAPSYKADEVNARNQAVLKALPDGGTVGFYQIGDWVMVGDGHDFESLERLASYDYVEGEIRIEKGGLLAGAGTLYVSGSNDPDMLTQTLSQITDKTIEFE